jgi:uncharacterized damage-inducible protein DinB
VDYVEENAAIRQHILELVRGLEDEQFLTPAGRDWTVAAVLGHLAFWDRTHVGRLRRAVAEGLGAPPPLPEGLTDTINNAELPAWRRIPGRAAVELFDHASAEVDEYLRTLDPAVVESVRLAGMGRLVERYRHRKEHGAALEEALRR